VTHGYMHQHWQLDGDVTLLIDVSGSDLLRSERLHLMLDLCTRVETYLRANGLPRVAPGPPAADGARNAQGIKQSRQVLRDAAP